MQTFLPFLLVGVGGFLGAVLRYMVVLASERIFTTFCSYYSIFATLFVNMLGSFLAGLFLGIAVQSEISPLFRVFFVTGFLGGFTTFSAFSLQNFELLESNQIGALTLNIILNVGVCLFATLSGFSIVRT